MNSGSFADGVLGGLGLFLLGAWLLAEGLSQAFGSRLRAFLIARGGERLGAWSAGALLGLGSPLSEANSRALAGIANSGVLLPVHLLWCAAGHVAGLAALAWIFVVFAGTNAADALALALVAGGVACLWTAPERARGGIGRALAGAGLVLFGMNLIAGGFENARGLLHLDGFFGGTLLHAIVFAVVGAAFTAGLRSAAATIVLAASAARGGALDPSSAAAVALGAVLASAWGALLALDSGTVSARRAALGVLAVHIAATLGGAGLALGLGPALNNPPGFLADPARSVALLLSLSPLFPLLLLYGLDARMIALADQRFQDQEGDELQPQHIDDNLRALPPLAFEALLAEVRRQHAVARRLAASVLAREQVTDRREETDRNVLSALSDAIDEGVAALARRPLDADSAAALPALTRAVQASWELGEQSAWLHAEGFTRGGPLGPALESRLLRVQLELARLLDSLEPAGADSAQRETQLAENETRIYELRVAATERCTTGELSAIDLEASLERLSTLRRMAQLAVDSTSDLIRAHGALEQSSAPEGQGEEILEDAVEPASS